MILFVAMGREATRRSPSDLAPSLLGIPYFTIHFASLSMILFVIKKRIFAKYQPLNLCSLTKPSPSPGAPQIIRPAGAAARPGYYRPASAQQGEAKPQQQHDTPSAQETEKKPQQERKRLTPRRPAQRRRPQPSDQETAQPTTASRPDLPAADRLQGAAALAPSSGDRRKQRRREGEKRERPHHAQLQRLST